MFNLRKTYPNPTLSLKTILVIIVIQSCWSSTGGLFSQSGSGSSLTKLYQAFLPSMFAGIPLSSSTAARLSSAFCALFYPPGTLSHASQIAVNAGQSLLISSVMTPCKSTLIMFQIPSSIVNQLNLALPVGVAARQAISDLQISCFDPYFFFLLTSTYYTTMTRCPNALLYLGQYFHYYLIYYGYKFLNQSFAYVNSLCYGMQIYVLQSLTNKYNKNWVLTNIADLREKKLLTLSLLRTLTISLLYNYSLVKLLRRFHLVYLLSQLL